MAVLKLYPHTLSYQQKTEGYKDDNGDYHKGGTEWVEDYKKCDAVPAGKEDVITYEDGTQSSYSYVVYLGKDCREFHRNDLVRINFFDNKPGTEFSVKGFHRYQHQCKLWI
ncbi:MAG: hypothetical protein Q4F85_06175 [Prevotella sp.]|nr:hypothetical protein [Oscillospiraceae bacterium]MDO5525647.1 hypothetical protein [Prevotella sp.]